MEKTLKTMLIIAIVIIVVVVAYQFSSYSSTSEKWTDTFYNYLNGKYDTLAPELDEYQ